jgi:sulfur carrier protein
MAHSTETSRRIEVVIELVVNGEPRRFPAPLTVAQLVQSLDLGGRRIAVEKNGEIVPRSRHADTPLASGDRLEIVVAVGGG